MKRLVVTAMLAIFAAIATAAAQEPVISPAQFQKASKYLDTAGSKYEFPSPLGQSLGLAADASGNLPVVMIQTNDHMVYFCRSELDHAVYVIWARVPGDREASYLFATGADFKPTAGLYLHTERFPQPVDLNSNEVDTFYKKTLTTLVKDIDSSPPPKE